MQYHKGREIGSIQQFKSNMRKEAKPVPEMAQEVLGPGEVGAPRRVHSDKVVPLKCGNTGITCGVDRNANSWAKCHLLTQKSEDGLVSVAQWLSVDL